MNIRFLGFGEANSSIARGLMEQHPELRISAYDILLDIPARRTGMLERMELCGAVPAGSPEELAMEADVILAATPADFSVSTAESIAPFIPEGCFYLDLSTATPGEKKTIFSLMKKRGARMVDGAMLGQLLVNLHRIPTLAAGPHAADCAALLNPLGMRITPVEGSPGTATSIKFLRSVVSKGLMALFFESLQAAQHFGVEEVIVDSLLDSYGPDFLKIINSYLSGTCIHAARRLHEMENVLAMLKEEDLPCEMTEACIRWMERIKEARIPDRFPEGNVPREWKALLSGWGLNEKSS